MTTRVGAGLPAPRAIVTGGAGFVGGHLADRLIAEGCPLLVVDDLSSGVAANVPREARFESVDIASDGLERLFRSFDPTIVFHLAAQASVPASMADPLRDLAVNVVGTYRVAEAARSSGVERLVFVSSGGAIYGESRRPATEGRLPAPASYYGIHKLTAEGYVARSGLAYAIARPSNIYGQRQGAGLEGAVVASFVDQALASGELRIHGDGRQTRDFIHVSDVTEALARLGRPDRGSGLWNVAVGHATSIIGLADQVEAAIGRPLARSFAPRRAGDVSDSAVSAERLRATGWAPRIDLATGLVELIRARE